jgi:Flp pilus assembly protein TadD
MSRLVLKLAVSSVALAAVNVAAIAAAPSAKHAARAEKALARKKLADAIVSAEAAVAVDARNAELRMLLGRVYLEAGRFQSAAASFADALTLDPTRGGAALSLALARIGLGDQGAARAVLDAHGDRIPAGDRGLALALSGDPAAGVALLEAEVRGGGSDAKTRQNLALAYALAGRWPEAKLMASYDLDPGTLAQRIMDWSRFTREQQASAQVASLLGVAPGADPGMPVQLALTVQPSPVRLAEVAPPPSPPPPVKMAEAPASPEPVAPVQAEAPAVQFASSAAVVQSVPAATPVATFKAEPVLAPRLRPALFVQPTGGRFAVQLGAYDTAAVAEHGWTRLTQRIAGLSRLTPSLATVVHDGATFHRLSVSGFATRSVAVSFCEQLRAKGGQCFVRETAGDVPLQWARRGGGTRLAAR